jgi:hypothetical protein
MDWGFNATGRLDNGPARNGIERRAAFSESIYGGPRGDTIGLSYQRYYNPYNGERCSESQQACPH